MSLRYIILVAAISNEVFDEFLIPLGKNKVKRNINKVDLSIRLLPSNDYVEMTILFDQGFD